IAIDEATVENGCLHYIRGSHKWGYVATKNIPYLVSQLKDDVVLVPRKPGYGLIHHSLLLHYSGPNQTAQRRRGIPLHYIRSSTGYIGPPGQRQRPFLLMRGKEIPGRV